MKALMVPLSRPVGTGAVYTALLLLGLAALDGLPLALAPDVDYPSMSVSVPWGQVSPETMEALVTSRIESEAEQIRGVREVLSVSARGFSQIQLQFERGTRMDRAEVFLRERLAGLRDELPDGVGAPTIQRTVPEEMERGSFVVVRAGGPHTPEALRRVLEESVLPRVLSVPGIAGVEIYGGDRREIRMDLDPGAVERGLVRTADAVGALDRLGGSSHLGMVRAGSFRVPVVHERAEVGTDPLRDKRISGWRDRPLRVSNVARVADTWEEPRRLSRVNGEPAILLVLEREPGTNVIRVAAAARDAIHQLQPLLPAGVSLETLHDQSEQIREELAVLAKRALVSILAIFGVLVLFQGRVRAPLVVMASVLFSALATFLLFRACGLGMNLVTLSGLALAFGMSVDNSIVILENVAARRRGRRRAGVGSPDRDGTRENLGHRDRLRALAATREVLFPLLAATCTTAVVLMPFLYLSGELRAFYLPFALSVCLSLLASLGIALTLTPSLSHWSFGGGKQASESSERTLRSLGSGTVDRREGIHREGIHREGIHREGIHREGIHREGIHRALQTVSNTASSFVTRWFDRSVGWVLRHRWIPITTALLLFGGSVWVFQTQISRGAIFPSDADTGLRVGLGLPSGAEIARTDALIASFERLVLEHDFHARGWVEQVETTVQGNRASLNIRLSPVVIGTSIPQVLKDDLTLSAATVSGASIAVSGYGPGFSSGGSNVSPSFQLSLRGPDFLELSALAEDLGRRLSRNPRIRDVDTNASSWLVDRETELAVVPDREAMSRMGVGMDQLVDALQPAISSDLATRTLSTSRGDINGRVRLGDGDALTPEALLGMGARTPGDEDSPALAFPLGALLEVTERPVQAEIRRREQEYERSVTFEYRGPRRIGNRFVRSFVENTELPLGYSLRDGLGVFLTREEETEIYLAIGLALGLIYMVSAALFESLSLPFVALLSVPLSFVGIAAGFWATGESFDRTAYVGLILLAGIAINNALLLVHRAGALLRSSRDRFYAARRAAVERMRPITATTVTSVAGLLPLAIASGTGSENWRTLALSAMAGLTASAVFTLFLVPALFTLFAKRQDAVLEPQRRLS